MKTGNCQFPGLKKWYESHNVSVTKPAELSGVNRDTIRGIVYGGRGTRIDTAQLIADAAGLTIDELFRMPPVVLGSGVKDRSGRGL